jgi:membrane associated rhomboid family serine protease
MSSYYQNNNILNTIAPITKSILIINFIIWAGCSLIQSPNPDAYPPVVDLLGLHYFEAKGFYLFQLVTYMFTHESFNHLFFNMFALFMFGSVLERTLGQKRYLIYYFVTGIGAGIIQLLICYWQVKSGYIPEYYIDYLVTIGASGAIFGLLLAFGMLFPDTPLFLMFVPIPIKAKYFVIGYGLIEFFFGISNRAGDNVAHFAHLGGMLFGIIMILYWKRKDKAKKNDYHYF